MPSKAPPSNDPASDAKNVGKHPPDTALPITTQLRVFMQRNQISEDEIKAILMVADGGVHFIQEPAPGNVTTGQMQWALLIALKNCILINDLSVDPEDVRSVCQDKGFYDTANFGTNFKKSKHARLFKGPMERQGDPQGLTTEGQAELAKVIRQLAKVQS